MNHRLPFMSRLVGAIACDEKTVTRRLIRQPKFNRLIHCDPDWYLRAWRDGTPEAGYLHVPARWSDGTLTDETVEYLSPPARAGDVMHVCEALVAGDAIGEWGRRPVLYLSDGEAAVDAGGERCSWPWKVRTLSARYCPTWAVRYRRQIVSARPERLSEITDEEAVREGVAHLGWEPTLAGFINGFRALHRLTLDPDHIWVWRYEWAPGDADLSTTDTTSKVP